MKKPNILLITTDQQRFDSLAVNGNQYIKTPHIDKLANEGINFRNAQVQNPVCVPSRACIQTGRYTHQHGVTYMENYMNNTPGLPLSEKTFMEYLQDAGYSTSAFGKIHMYPEKGFDHMSLTQGKGQRWTDTFIENLGPAPLGDTYSAWLENKRPGGIKQLYSSRKEQAKTLFNLGYMDIPLDQSEYVDFWICDETINKIEEQTKKEKPFFIWTGFCGPHGPFDPPEPYRSLYSPNEIPLPIERDGQNSWRKNWSEPDMRKCIAYYYGLVTFIDNEVGRIINKLNNLNISENTLIIYTSDHGEMLGERGKMGKGLFYKPVINVPLIIKPPKLNLPKVVNEVVEVSSSASTILDYAEIDIPDCMTIKSLKPVIESNISTNDQSFCEYVDNNKRFMGKCVTTSEGKFIWWSDKSAEYYDLKKDPLESNNLIDNLKYKKKIDVMRAKLFSWLSKTEWRSNY